MTLRTPNLDLPYIAPGQAQKHVTHNEAIRALDAIIHLSALSVMDDPPQDPQDGERYIIGAAPRGVFEGHAQKIAAFQDGAWVFLSPKIGWQIYNQSDESVLIYNGSAWQGSTSNAAISEITPRLGVNGTADDVNRLLVKSEAVLLDHIGAGHQLKINKANPSDTGSLLFQTAYQGHAEMGLTGSNDFALRVSPDGASFYDGMKLSPKTGDAHFPNGVNRDRLLPTIASTGNGEEFFGFPNLVTISTSQFVFRLIKNRLYFNAVYIDRPTDITGCMIGLTIPADEAEAVLRLGIFDIGRPEGDDWVVGQRRIDFGTLPANAAQAHDLSLPSPIRLERGWYMFATGTNGNGAHARCIQNYTPGLNQFRLSGTGASTFYRISGPAAYAQLNNQSAFIENGFPDDWMGQKVTDVSSINFQNHMFFLPKFRHWNAPE